MGACFLEELEKDEALQTELRKIIETVDKLSSATGDTESAALAEQFDEMIDNLSDYAEDMRDYAEKADDEDTVIISIATKGTTVIQRRIEFVDRYVITIDTEISSKKASLEFKATDPDEEQVYMSGEASRTTSKGSTDLSVEVYSGDSEQTFFSVELEDYKVVKNHGVKVPTFSLSVKVPSEEIEVTVKAESDDDYVITGTASVYGESYSVKISSTLSGKADLSDFEAPEESDDSYEDFAQDLGNGIGEKFGDLFYGSGYGYGYDTDYDEYY